MKRFGFLLICVLFAGCSASDSSDSMEPQAEPEPEPIEPIKESQPEGQAGSQQKDMKTEGIALEATPIKDYADLEKYGGQTIYVIGTFDVHPRFRGKHGLVRLDSGLVIYLPHIDQWYKGYDWYRFLGQKVYVGGKLHSYVANPIDGMKGPYLDEPTPLVGADQEGQAGADSQPAAPPPAAEPVPK